MNTRHGQRMVGEGQQKIGGLMQTIGERLPNKVGERVATAGSTFSQNGAERYANNAMTKEEIKKEYDRRLSRQQKKAGESQGGGISNRQAKRLERQLNAPEKGAMSDRQSRRLERMLK